jgi:hypothetical protein
MTGPTAHRAALDAGAPLPCAEHGLLHEVLGVLDRAEQSLAVDFSHLTRPCFAHAETAGATYRKLAAQCGVGVGQID